MPTVERLSALFKALARKDLASAEREALTIAADEQRKGHSTAAQLLKGALATNGAHGVHELQSVRDGSASFLNAALSLRTRAVRLEDVALPVGNRQLLEELVQEFKGQAKLQARGIRRRSKILFHGPPGCGKTLTAQALACALDLPIYVVRFDAVVGAYLGQTATHLRQLFQFAEATRCIVLFDEIDALGKRRGNASDVGELDRIVVSLMQELELSEVAGFVIATSNLATALDDALWRRFDLSMKFPPPTRLEIRRFITVKSRQYALKLNKSIVANASRFRSYADAERAIEDAARRVALKTD